MKQYIPSRVYGIADKIDRYIDAEKVAEFSIEMKKQFGLYKYLYPGYDGFAYLINPIDESAEYWKVKTSDHSFELSEKITIDLKGCKLKQELGKAVISKGVAYITAEDSKSLYIVNLANQVDIIQVTIPDEYYVDTQLIALNNGGVKFGVTSNNSHRGAFCYPDGKIILQGEKKTDRNFKGFDARPKLITDNLMAYGDIGYSQDAGYRYSSYGRQVCNYLGSIFNLPQPIVKTAATSMKITYTLTNV